MKSLETYIRIVILWIVVYNVKMIVKTQKQIEFSSPVEVLYDEEELRKAILWYSNRPVCRLKHVYLHGRYYAVSIYEEKIHIHRLLMMYWLNRDIGRHEHVHHINGNKYNNLRDNLEVIPAFLHISKHQKNIPKSEEHKIKIGIANKNRKGKKLKRKYSFNEDDMQAISNGTETINSIAEKYGCDWSTVDRHYKEFLYENPELIN